MDKKYRIIMVTANAVDTINLETGVSEEDMEVLVGNVFSKKYDYYKANDAVLNYLSEKNIGYKSIAYSNEPMNPKGFIETYNELEECEVSAKTGFISRLTGCDCCYVIGSAEEERYFEDAGDEKWEREYELSFTLLAKIRDTDGNIEGKILSELFLNSDRDDTFFQFYLRKLGNEGFLDERNDIISEFPVEEDLLVGMLLSLDDMDSADDVAEIIGNF